MEMKRIIMPNASLMKALGCSQIFSWRAKTEDNMGQWDTVFSLSVFLSSSWWVNRLQMKADSF